MDPPGKCTRSKSMCSSGQTTNPRTNSGTFSWPAAGPASSAFCSNFSSRKTRRTSTSQDTPHVKTLGELLAILRSHFNPAPSTLMECFRFNNRSRRERETLGQFVGALRGLASACAFGDQLDSLLRDRFVCGINNPAMQTRLLELPDPTLEAVVKAAMAMEAAAKDAGEISRATDSPSAEAAVNDLATKGMPVRSSTIRAGKLGTWHVYAEGEDEQQTAAAGSCSSAARLHVVAEEPPIFDMWRTGFVPSSMPPYMLTVEICGHPISMEVDTGASVSVMAGKLFKRTCLGVSVEASGVTLRSSSGQLSQIQGQAHVSVRFGDREATLPLYLAKGSSPTLLRRNRIHALGVRLPEYPEASLHMVQSCQICQEHQRASRHVESTPWPFSQRPSSRLHVDFGGHFKSHYFLVLVDAFSKWEEVLPATTPSAGATIAALPQVFAAQGFPDIIVSDNGPAFPSAEYLTWLTKNEIRRMMVPPYHPASNGAAERVVQTIKDNLQKRQTGDFRTQIARILFQYRTTPHDVTDRAPCELLLGGMVKTPLDVLHPDLRSTVLLKQLKQKLAADQGCRIGPLSESGAPVFARNFRLGPPWSAGQVVSPASA
ncbi:uncharacterized protein [Dermacentor albipictus]|uniref:uncharacterized protein n=1 Tax=Dermacentor albipictus TaxID=60249 RepID=UPI0031FC000B